MIEELIDYSTCDHGPIELVISEIKATALLARVCTELNNSVNNTGIRIKLPTGNLPTLLTDDRLLQLLLVKLLSCVIVLSLVGSETEIDLSFDSEFCAITIVTLLAHPMTSDELESIFGEYRQDAPETFGGQSLTNLSLVKNFAQRLNLNLKASLMQKDRICIELSGIKVI